MSREARTAALLLSGALALACKRSPEGGSPSGGAADSSAAASKPGEFTPKLELAKLRPIARYDGDFASKIHDGWISTRDDGNVTLVFSRQKKACTIGLPGGDPLTASCGRVSVSLRDSALATDHPERVTLIDGERGAKLSHFLVVDPSPSWLAGADGSVVAPDVQAAWAWANGDATYVAGKQGVISVHRTGKHKASMPLPKEDETHGTFFLAAGHLFTTTFDGETRRVKAYPLAAEGPPLGAPTELVSLDPQTSARPWIGCRAGDTTHLVLSELRPGLSGGSKVHHVLRVRGGKLSKSRIDGKGHAEFVSCTPEGVRIVEKPPLGGTEAQDIRCAGDGCSAEALPKRLFEGDVAPLGDRLLVLWTRDGALRAEIGHADKLYPGATGRVLVDGAQDASIHAIEVRGEEALVVFSVKADMYAVALGASGRARPVVIATEK